MFDSAYEGYLQEQTELRCSGDENEDEYEAEYEDEDDEEDEDGYNYNEYDEYLEEERLINYCPSLQDFIDKYNLNG